MCPLVTYVGALLREFLSAAMALAPGFDFAMRSGHVSLRVHWKRSRMRGPIADDTIAESEEEQSTRR